ELVRFGGGMMLAKLANYAAGQGDSAVVVRSLGAEALGLYGRAIQLMVMPAMYIGDVLDRVLFPGMARFQDDPKQLGLAYGRAVALIALVSLPVSAGLLVLAPEIVRVLLGPKWTGITAPLQIFAAAMLFRTSYKISDATVRAARAGPARAHPAARARALLGDPPAPAPPRAPPVPRPRRDLVAPVLARARRPMRRPDGVPPVEPAGAGTTRGHLLVDFLRIPGAGK